MNWQIIAILIIIIIIVVWLFKTYQSRPQVKKAHKYAEISQLDDAVKRKQYIEKSEKTNIKDLDSDQLFTMATLYLRLQDDIQDQLLQLPLSSANHQKRAAIQEYRDQLIHYLSSATQNAQKTIRLAIAQRNIENTTLQPNQVADEFLFHDDAIERREHEIDQQAHTIAPIIQLPPIAKQYIAPTENINKLIPKWSPDPENVHDSAVGDSVKRHIQYLRTFDTHIFTPSTTIGTILLLMNQQKIQMSDDKHARIIRTLNRASKNDQNSRYNIGEVEALRLVIERAFNTETEEQKNNLQDALFDSLADCAPGDTGTVCSVGRISRYVTSIDGIDDNMGDVVKSVDAYRAEILNSIGKISASNINEDQMPAEINKICDQYKNQVSESNLQKIRNECLSAI